MIRSALLDRRKAAPLSQAYPNGFSTGIYQERYSPESRREFVEAYRDRVWVQRCINYVSQAAESVPVKAYRGDRRDPVEVDDHWLLDFLDRPNPRDPAMTFVGQSVKAGHMIGEWYWETVPGRGAGIAEAYPLRGHLVDIVPDQERAGKISGFTYDPNETGRRVQLHAADAGAGRVGEGDVIYGRYANPFDDFYGMAPLRGAKDDVISEYYAVRYDHRYFRNSARPDVVIGFDKASPQEMKDNRAAWDSFKGVDNAHRAAVMTANPQVTLLSQNPRDVEYLEGRRLAREGECAALGVPPILVGILDKATYCLPGDALVTTDRGPVAISDVRPGDRVWSMRDERLRLSTVAWSGQTGVRPLVTIRTRDRKLRCTDNHPVPVLRAGGLEWVAAGEVTRGDRLVAVTSIPEPGVRSCPTREDVTVGFMEFCGLLLGDGNVNRDRDGEPSAVTIARDGEARYMDHYRAVMRREFRQLARGGREYVTTAQRTRLPIRLQESERMTRFSSRLAARELVELGLDGTARTKRIPAWVFQLAPDLRAAFLRGFIDADGSVDKRGHITVHSASEALLRQVRELAVSVGVRVANVRAQRGEVTLPDGRRMFSVMWSFHCSHPALNADVIGSHDPQDQARMAAATARHRERTRNAGAPGGCHASTVCAVERGEVSVPVYDLTVPEAGNFVCEGLVVHNSNYEQAQRSFWHDTMIPLLHFYASWLTWAVVPYFDGVEWVEFDTSGLSALQENENERIDRLSKGVLAGVFTLNEARHAMSLDPVEGGDTLYLPMAQVPVVSLVAEGPQRPAEIDQGPGATPAGVVNATAQDITTQPVLPKRKLRGVNAARYMQLRNAAVRQAQAQGAKRLARAFAAAEKDVLGALTAGKARKATEIVTLLEQRGWEGDAEALLTAIQATHMGVAVAAGSHTGALLGVEVAMTSESPIVARVVAHQANRPNGIRTVAGRVKEDVLIEVREGLAAGLTHPQIAQGGRFAVGPPGDRGAVERDFKGVRGVYAEMKGWQAERIARTEAANAYNAGAAASYREAGVQLVDIVDGDDDEACGEANGSQWTVDEFDANPLEHPNAVMEGTRILPLGGVQMACRARWSGPVVTIRTAAGGRLTIGPNHPVLTGRGWLPASDLREGDNVVRGAVQERDAMGLANLDDVPATAEEIFAALAARPNAVSCLGVAAPDDLHGDGRFCEGEVEVVWADSALTDVPHLAFVEEAGEHVLNPVGVQDKALAGAGALLSGGDAVTLAAARNVGGGDVGRVVLGSSDFEPCRPHRVADEAIADPVFLCELESRYSVIAVSPDRFSQVGAGDRSCLTAAPADAALVEAPADRVGAGVQIGGEPSDAPSVEVTLDEVVEVESVDAFQGWAYDFQVEGRGFFADTYFSENCTRLGLPVIE